MMEIQVQHEKSKLSNLTTSHRTCFEAIISTTSAPGSTTLTAIHQRLSDLENEVKPLRNVGHSSAIHAAIKSKVPTVVKEYLGTSLDDTLHKHKALYHALMESILEDEDGMDKGVADRLKKRKPDDADRDEDPLAGPNQGLKRKKTSKDIEPSKKAKSIGTSKGTTKSQPKSTGKSAQAEETMFEARDTQVSQDLKEEMGNTDEPPVVKADPKDWFKKSKRPPTLDLKWNECKAVDSKPTQKWLSDLAKAEKSSKTFDDLMSTLIDFSAFAMNRLQISDLIQDILNNPEGDRYPFDLSKPLPLVQSRNCQIIPVDYFFNNDLAYLQGGSTGRTYTTSLTKTKATKYDLQGIKDM
ncbi:hypothetical protein Tco_1527215, partial [Tanacetum coccineum]